jgi:hypothetical protein
MSNRFTPAALAALSIAFASVGAQASEAQYCDGRLVARLFSSDVDNRGSMNVVTYWVQLQNTGGIGSTMSCTSIGTTSFGHP